MTADDATGPMTLASAWPIFGLRLRTARLELRLPTDDELLALIDVARAGIHPADEMPFQFPWSTLPSPAFERNFLQHHWRLRASWTPEDWILNFGIFLDGRPIGSQTVGGRQFAIYRTVDTGSWLGQPFQGLGYGTEMRAGVLGFAFDGLGARYADSGALVDNARSNRVSRALGYEENGRDELAPNGIAVPHQRWRMTAEAWRASPRPPITIEGLDACRDLFGA